MNNLYTQYYKVINAKRGKIIENVIKNTNEINSLLHKSKQHKEANLEKLGETNTMNCGEIASIVEYNSSMDITIQFESSRELVKTTYPNFKSGEVKSHFTPTIYGVGIRGIESTIDLIGNRLDSYTCWRTMLKRCYDTKLHKRFPTYIGCTVCDEWKYYNNFKKFYDDNYYSIEGETSHLDKDI